MTAPAFDELLRRLVAAGVDFVLIGGLAVNAWGVRRGTQDVDIVPDPDEVNLRRLAELAVELDGHVQTSEMLAGSAFSIEELLRSGQQVHIATSISVTVEIDRLVKQKFKPVGSATRSAKAGHGSLKLKGKIAGKKLGAGSYRATITATAPGTGLR